MLTPEESQRLEQIMRSLQADICRLHDKLDADEKRVKEAAKVPHGPPPMPEPVEIWLGELGHGFVPCWPHHPTATGPYQIIPGMMSLDELAKRGVFVCNERGRWYVGNTQGTVCAASMTDATALQTQWEATCIAREGGEP